MANSYENLKCLLFAQINNLNQFIEEISTEEVIVVENPGNKTTYLASDFDMVNKTCVINIRKSCSRVSEIIHFNPADMFAIFNSTKISFIPIDGKGLCKKDCDFVFFNNTNFCFVEMKLNATSTNDQAIRSNRVKAVDQLSKTLKYFNDVTTQNFFGLEKEAFIATPDFYPRENTAFQSLRINFLEEHGVQLFEAREKRF